LNPGRIAVGYVLFGIAWIAVSDRLVLALFETESTRQSAQTAKGWLFVGLSAIFIVSATRGVGALPDRQWNDGRTVTPVGRSRHRVASRLRERVREAAAIGGEPGS